MLLIPGLLRSIDNNLLRFLDSASAYAEIFIVTEKSFSQEVALLVDRYDAKAWYSEDLAAKYQRNSAYFPGALSQWLKFDYALNQALEWEEANGIKFEFIHRIRTDVMYPDIFHDFMVLPLKNRDTSNICMLNFHDFCFSARRDALSSLLNLASFFQDFTRDDAKLANILSFIDIDQLKHSEMQSACYLKSLPVGVLASNQTPDEFGLLLKEKYPSYPSENLFIEAAAAFASSLNDHQYMPYVLSLARKSSSLIRTWDNNHCCLGWTEHILARFYNFFGIYTYCYAGTIDLKISRLASSDFTFNILQMIDNDDVSFLSNTEIDWDKEIADFLEKGGRGSKLCAVFVGLACKYYPKLGKHGRSRLEVIFEIFTRRCTEDITRIFTEKVKLFASKVGMRLPSTDFYECDRSARDLMALKRFDEAQAKIKEGLEKMPNQIRLLMTASDVYRALGNREKSLEYAERLITHHPGDWNGYGKSAQDLMALKRFDEAQAKVQESLDRLPNQTYLLQTASDVYRALGNREKSLEYAERLAIRRPGDWNGYGKSAEDLMALKRFDEAQAKIKEGLEKMPNQIRLLVIASDIYRALGNREKSLEYAEILIIHHPSDWNGYGKSAQDLMALKRFDEAQAKIKEGLGRMPNQASLLIIENDINRALGKPEILAG
jgi:tetratricopeptide (TPR) repeat protein